MYVLYGQRIPGMMRVCARARVRACALPVWAVAACLICVCTSSRFGELLIWTRIWAWTNREYEKQSGLVFGQLGDVSTLADPSIVPLLVEKVENLYCSGG